MNKEEGRVPTNWLVEKDRVVTEVSKPSQEGSVPDMMLVDTMKVCARVMGVVTVDGNVPEKEFACTWKCCSALKEYILSGIVPVNELAPIVK